MALAIHKYTPFPKHGIILLIKFNVKYNQTLNARSNLPSVLYLFETQTQEVLWQACLSRKNTG